MLSSHKRKFNRAISLVIAQVFLVTSLGYAVPYNRSYLGRSLISEIAGQSNSQLRVPVGLANKRIKDALDSTVKNKRKDPQRNLLSRLFIYSGIFMQFFIAPISDSIAQAQNYPIDILPSPRVTPDIREEASYYQGLMMPSPVRYKTIEKKILVKLKRAMDLGDGYSLDLVDLDTAGDTIDVPIKNNDGDKVAYMAIDVKGEKKITVMIKNIKKELFFRTKRQKTAGYKYFFSSDAEPQSELISSDFYASLDQVKNAVHNMLRHLDSRKNSLFQKQASILHRLEVKGYYLKGFHFLTAGALNDIIRNPFEGEVAIPVEISGYENSPAFIISMNYDQGRLPGFTFQYKEKKTWNFNFTYLPGLPSYAKTFFALTVKEANNTRLEVGENSLKYTVNQDEVTMKSNTGIEEAMLATGNLYKGEIQAPGIQGAVETITIILDRSGTIDEKEANAISRFIERTLEGMPSDAKKGVREYRLNVILGAKDSVMETKAFSSDKDLINYVNNDLTSAGTGETFLWTSIERAIDEIAGNAAVIIVTDGVSDTSRESTVDPEPDIEGMQLRIIEEAKKKNAQIYFVGVDKANDNLEAKNFIASYQKASEGKSQYIYVEDFQELGKLFVKIDQDPTVNINLSDKPGQDLSVDITTEGGETTRHMLLEEANLPDLSGAPRYLSSSKLRLIDGALNGSVKFYNSKGEEVTINNQDHALLGLVVNDTIAATMDKKPAERPVVLVLDVTTSMIGKSLENMKTSVKAILDQKGGPGKVAVVLFNRAGFRTGIKVLGPDEIKDLDKYLKAEDIYGRKTSAATNGYQALTAGFRELRKVMEDYSSGADMIFFSDGNFNVGGITKLDMLSIAEHCAFKDTKFSFIGVERSVQGVKTGLTKNAVMNNPDVLIENLNLLNAAQNMYYLSVLSGGEFMSYKSPEEIEAAFKKIFTEYLAVDNVSMPIPKAEIGETADLVFIDNVTGKMFIVTVQVERLTHNKLDFVKEQRTQI